MTLQWIDRMTGVAYVCVRHQWRAFREFLDAIDWLLAHPDWRPGMPIVEDLRELTCPPPPTCVEEWRAYVEERRRLLAGCRWAVVTCHADAPIVSVLDTAARDAAPNGVTLRQFASMADAHLWLAFPSTADRSGS